MFVCACVLVASVQTSASELSACSAGELLGGGV